MGLALTGLYVQSDHYEPLFPTVSTILRWGELLFLRDKEKREVDFLLARDGAPWILIEAKTSADQGLSKALIHYHKILGTAHAFQIVQDLPYVDVDCFQRHDPIQVPALTLLSQLI